MGNKFLKGMKDYILPTKRCGPEAMPFIFKHGLPDDEADSACKSRYAEEIVKLTVQIAEPSVMMIDKDVSATFTDHLGTIGQITTKFFVFSC